MSSDKIPKGQDSNEDKSIISLISKYKKQILIFIGLTVMLLWPLSTGVAYL